MTLKQILQDFNLQQDTDKDTTHCYIEQFYESAFEPYRSKKISILEIGISLGASLKLWKEYFKNSIHVIGIDNREYFVYEKYKNIEGVTYYFEDAYNPEIVKKLPKFDIIIDDGCHDLDAQLKAIEIYFPLLKKSGIYIVEDIQQQLYPNCYDEFLKVIPDEFKSNHKWLDLRSYKNRPDDTLLIINK